MANQKLKYEFDVQVVNYILMVLDKVQIAGIQSAQDLITITQLLKNPLNKDDLDKEIYENLKEKFEKKTEEKKI